MRVLAAELVGGRALLMVYGWLLSAIVAAIVSSRKGYGEKPGLATGLTVTWVAVAALLVVPFGWLIAPFVAIVIWLVVPAKPDSAWALQGPLGRKGGGKSLAELRAEADPGSSVGGGAPAGAGTGAGQEAAGDPGGQMGRAKG